MNKMTEEETQPRNMLKHYQNSVETVIKARGNIIEKYHPDHWLARNARIETEDLIKVRELLKGRAPDDGKLIAKIKELQAELAGEKGKAKSLAKTSAALEKLQAENAELKEQVSTLKNAITTMKAP
jgi:chromosome segregation ATPase